MTPIEKTLAYEGGYVNDPNDAGGETNFGISKRQYPNVDIKNLTPELASEIYQKDYIDKLGLSALTNLKVQWKVFDIGVNMGPRMAAVILQVSLGLSPDGVFGPKTMLAANNVNEAGLVDAMCLIQALYYNGICLRNPSQQKFLNGWLRRANDRGEGL